MPLSVSEIPRQPIRPLSPFLANQIAAGEVVERPASIIKELLENALDAGASRIEILLERGGLDSILIRDNGSGIPADELPLALAPHATSKIRQAEDLTAIESMGFRGEALASIASVSRLQLTSRPADSEEAWTIRGRHGEGDEQACPASHPPGTSVQVEALFFNTPARRRFLRSERTEYRHCEDVVRRMALSHFEVAIHLSHNQRRIYRLPACRSQAERQRRLARLCGKAFADQALVVDYRTRGLRLRGWVGLPEAARPQSDLQYFFVNGRIIRDRLVSHAVREAYADSLYPGRYPAYVLYLEVPAGEIDINVHPTKHEVRFHQGRLVHDFITHSLQQSLFRQGSIAAVHVSEEPAPWYRKQGQKPGRLTDISTFQPVPDSPTSTPTAVVREKPSSHPRPVAPRGTAPLTRRTDGTEAGDRTLAVIDNRHALYAYEKAVLLVDIPRLQAAHLQERWRQEARQAGVVSRPLLIPERLTPEAPVRDWIAAQQAGLLQQAGLDLQPGEATVLLRQIPVAMQASRFLQWLPEVLAELSRQGISEGEALRQRLVEPLVAHRLRDWQRAEVDALLAELLADEATDLFSHPAVRRLDGAVLASLFEA